MAQVKKYPFSCAKHAHDVEFARNFTMNLCSDMEAGVVSFAPAEYDALCARRTQLTQLLSAMLGSSDGRVCWLSGPMLQLAKECVLWAGETRAARRQSRFYGAGVQA